MSLKYFFHVYKKSVLTSFKKWSKYELISIHKYEDHKYKLHLDNLKMLILNVMISLR